MKHSILISEIIFIETFRNKLYIHTKDRKYEYYQTLTDMEIKNIFFFRINRYILINFRCIKDVANKKITLVDGSIFTISRSKVQSFKIAYIQYLETMKV